MALTGEGCKNESKNYSNLSYFKFHMQHKDLEINFALFWNFCKFFRPRAKKLKKIFHY